jgi:hypothetical protein
MKRLSHFDLICLDMPGVAGDWVKVSSSMPVLNYIIKLHLRIAENYRLLGRVMKCIKSYEDAYTVR